MIGCGALHLEAAGRPESSIPLSEKAMAQLRNPSTTMPDEIKREISAVMERHFQGLAAAVLGGNAETNYHAVTTRASRFGARDSLMSRLTIESVLKIPGPGAYPAVVSLYISFFANDNLSGNFRSSAESHRRMVKNTVERNERRRQSAAAANRPFQSNVLQLGSYTAIPAQGKHAWTWESNDGQMRIVIRTLSDGVSRDLIRSKAETLHAQMEAAGLYNFLSRLTASRDAVPPTTTPPIPEPGDCGKGAALTRYLEALRTQHRNIQILDGELEWLLNNPSPDPEKVAEYGRKAERIAAEYHAVFRDFQRAETRRGLFEELDLLVETPVLLNEVVIKYQHLAQVPVKLLEPEDLARFREESSRTIVKLARDHFASRLESEGLRDILTSESWEEALEKTAGHARRKVEEFIEGETAKTFGFGFHDVQSARRALQLQMRREVRRQAAKLLVKVTSNQIVIEIVAGPVIRWIERDLIPRLREALRQKGNLPNRVTRSVETMENARRELNALTCDAKLREVRRRIVAARETLHAARFLEGDLKRADAGVELGKLEAAKNNLERTISLAQRRFLLDKDDYEDDLVLIDEVIGALRDILKRSVPSRTDVRPPVERKPPVQRVDPPQRDPVPEERLVPRIVDRQQWEKMREEVAVYAHNTADPWVADMLKRGYVGTIIGIVGDCFIFDYSGRRLTEERAVLGQLIRIGDTIMTGNNGRVKIQWFDRDESKRVGPTTFNVSTDSIMNISRFRGPGGTPFSVSALSLIKGAVRAFVRNWTGQSHLSIRATGIIAEIRGTDVVITCDPDAERMHVYVLEGRLNITSAIGEAKSLTDNQKLTVNRGLMGDIQPLSRKEWDTLVKENGMEDMDSLSSGELKPLLKFDVARDPDPAGSAAIQSVSPQTPAVSGGGGGGGGGGFVSAHHRISIPVILLVGLIGGSLLMVLAILVLRSRRDSRTSVLGYLDVVYADGGMKTVPVGPKVSIGRAKDNSVVLNDEKVSGHHAVLYTTDEGTFIVDLGSANGTHLNGKIVNKAWVNSGDALTFGTTTVRFRFSDGPGS